ncbi:bifunctional metallophosphatase/5'-nucleotidase [Pseudogracilibacillus sp. ICA-222130]|uniref:bifunctional metallophosphatase/5'-nucleotidase n=1 Tax=Pseudogracilibacillus sp. ICA-222130 TaxID=3134655 RepID=UPI0030BDA69B
MVVYEPKRLTIIQMNDTHAYYDLHPEMFLENGKEIFRDCGGYARIATILKEARKENPNGVLALDNGDTFHGTYPVVHSKGEALIPIMNALQLDGMTAHWEYAYGPKQLEKLVHHLKYPLLVCNCYLKQTDELMFPSHMTIERAGLKIGVIGIAEHIVNKTMPPEFSEGIYFTGGTKELPHIIATLRTVDRVDLVVVLSHLGFPQDVKLAREVDGIDILLSGHTHHTLRSPVVENNTIIMQSGCHGAHIGRLDVEVGVCGVEQVEHRLIEVTEKITPDPEVAALVTELEEPYKEMLDEVVGKTEVALHRYGQLESTMDNLLLEALLWETKADVAFSNGWRYGGPVIPGPITMRDVWNIIPTNPPVSIVMLTGKEILEMLEEDLEHTFAADPYEQIGGYMKRCLGLKMYVKLENPPGMRVQDLYIGGERVDMKRWYKGAFVTVQGVPKKYGTDRSNLDVHAVDVLRSYIEECQVVAPRLRGTVTVV